MASSSGPRDLPANWFESPPRYTFESSKLDPDTMQLTFFKCQFTADFDMFFKVPREPAPANVNSAAYAHWAYLNLHTICYDLKEGVITRTDINGNQEPLPEATYSMVSKRDYEPDDDDLPAHPNKKHELDVHCVVCGHKQSLDGHTHVSHC